MNNLICKIMNGEGIADIFKYVIRNIYTKGPISVTDMEILSYLCLYQPYHFAQYEADVLKFMGLFYKNIQTKNLPMAIFGMYRKDIVEKYKESFTPVQANIIKGIKDNHCFSFSAPTSTGKSFVFLKLIAESHRDIVIVVPSRALINEYYIKLKANITDKSVNILTFIDKINTKRAKRNIFIVTPERCKELFKQKGSFDVETFMFDEAQLSNEDSRRGLYFDSIVRRCQSAYPNAKFVFAHPFVRNPEAQITKNHFARETSLGIQYKLKNVGQMFFCRDGDSFYHFGIEKNIMGNQRILCKFDPLEKAIRNSGSILVYVTKSSIYNKKIVSEFKKYIDLCDPIKDRSALGLISQLQHYVGGSYKSDRNLYSQMLDLMRRGIVIHHGSLPLEARLIIEKFTQEGFCKICFATSTLEQGINMPFEIVYLHKFEASRQLALKNLIGRAGRSSDSDKFDFGSVIVRKSCMTAFRKIMLEDEVMKDISSIDDTEIHDDDFNEFREAIRNNTISDEYNLTQKEVENLSSDNVKKIISNILEAMFLENSLLPLAVINKDINNKLALYACFAALYACHLGRALVVGEEAVLNTAIKIMIWRVYCRTFKEICWYRYAYASKLSEREELTKKISQTEGIQKLYYQQKLNSLEASFCTEYKDLPDKHLSLYSMFNENGRAIKAKDVDYDRIVFDTYDYIDKLLGFKLGDVFYAAIYEYYKSTGDIRADKLAKYIKYGTDKPKEIWMLRYGLSFEDIELLSSYIKDINEQEIVFDDSVLLLPSDQLNSIERYL